MDEKEWYRKELPEDVSEIVETVLLVVLVWGTIAMVIFVLTR